MDKKLYFYYLKEKDFHNNYSCRRALSKLQIENYTFSSLFLVEKKLTLGLVWK